MRIEFSKTQSENVFTKAFPYAKHVFVFTRRFIVVCLLAAKRDIFPAIPTDVLTQILAVF